MPIDYDRKFIFVHIPKTAGTSVMCSLFNVGVDREEFIDTAALPHEYQRRHLIGNEGFLRLHHYPLRRIAEQPLRLEDFFVFAFVRNPFDRLVSEYHFLRLHRSMPFRDFALNLVRMVFDLDKTEHWFSFHLLPQVEFLSFDGRSHCDFVGRFETLDHDYRVICERLGIERRALPVHKKSERSPYREYYDPDSRALVEKYYARDLETFGYEF